MALNKKNILWFITGLTLSLLLSGAVYYVLILETLDIFGIESIKDPETRDAKIFYTSLATSLLIGCIAIYFRKKMWRYLSIGFVLPAAIGIFPIITVGPTFFKKSNYYEDFNREKWLSEEYDKIKMARLLVKKKELLGLTKEEVVKKLGEGYFIEEEMNYKIYVDCGLGIRFQNDRVTDYGIWVRD